MSKELTPRQRARFYRREPGLWLYDTWNSFGSLTIPFTSFEGAQRYFISKGEDTSGAVKIALERGTEPGARP